MCEYGNVKLDPERYECTVDGHDVTELVHEELSLRIPLAFDRRAEMRPFQVVVTCPGGAKEHDVSVSGTYTR
jgi:hypothetical protein